MPNPSADILADLRDPRFDGPLNARAAAEIDALREAVGATEYARTLTAEPERWREFLDRYAARDPAAIQQARRMSGLA